MGKRDVTAPLRFIRHPVDPGWVMVVVALALALAVLTRLALEQVANGIIPFVITFPAVIGATLLAGARAGALTAVGCLALVWWFVFPNWAKISGTEFAPTLNLALTAGALVATVWLVADYRRTMTRLNRQCEREVDLLSLLIREIDHRTKNNFQIASSLLGTQAVDSGDERIREALGAAADRLASIASVYRSLEPSEDGKAEVRIDRHLGDICERLRSGLLPDGVTLALQAEPGTTRANTALVVGLIVNEWITNAAKYAFPDGHGQIAVTLECGSGAMTVRVGDDGVGRGGKDGGGSRLIQRLSEAIDGAVAVESREEKGTLCSLTIPA